MDHVRSDANIFWYIFTWTRTRLDPYLNKYPIPDQYLIFHTRSTPNTSLMYWDIYDFAGETFDVVMYTPT